MIRPCIYGDDQFLTTINGIACRHFNLVSPITNVYDRRIVAQSRAIRAGEPAVGGVASVGRGDAALGLIEAVDVVGEAELRPAAHYLGGVEMLERHTGLGHAVDVVAQRNLGALARGEVKTAGFDDDLIA